MLRFDPLVPLFVPALLASVALLLSPTLKADLLPGLCPLAVLVAASVDDMFMFG